MNYEMPTHGGGGNANNINPKTPSDAVFDKTLLRDIGLFCELIPEKKKVKKSLWNREYDLATLPTALVQFKCHL